MPLPPGHAMMRVAGALRAGRPRGGRSMGFVQLAEARRQAVADRERLLWEEARRAAGALRDLGATRVWVFGSLARGEVMPHSDLDLLVVWDTPWDYWESLRRAYRAIGPKVALDLVVVPREALARPTSLMRTVLREGVEV